MYHIISSIHGQSHVLSPTFRSIAHDMYAVRSYGAEKMPLFIVLSPFLLLLCE